ncbi:MAG TPA: peptidoglycan DD-metalloendopeptidase family protein [Terriglobia bacterium]|jgi:murein DD-endopeptidase MepM/ murein hydrolase activator NlpD|nr:peptidoglycan DD-metalloendopeptidase family protein [Terriglobia bacterium]
MADNSITSKSVLKRPALTSWRKRLIIIGAALVAIESTVLASIIHQKNVAEDLLEKEAHLAAIEARNIAARREIRSVMKLPRNTTFSGFLADQGLEPEIIHNVIECTRPVYNLAKVRSGNQVTFVTSGQGELREIGYEIDPEHQLWIRSGSDGFDASIEEIPFTTQVAAISGTVHSSLIEAIEGLGEQDQFAINFANIFAWQIDFNTETQDGDRFEAIVQKRILNGKFAGYGKILAAEYDSAGKRYQALLFHDASGQPAYYAPDGKAVKKAFLRSPLPFAAPITSRFSYHRFHPILKTYRPHLGIDYGVPIGTRVQAVANGTVVFAGWDRGGGREVKLRHARGYETFYLHLSRILVHKGEHVRQGQTIALSGMSGLATGPHLDFRIEEHGQFRNFLAMKLPPAQSVSQRDWPQFEKVRSTLLQELASIGAHANGVEQASLQSSKPSQVASQ